MFEQRRCEGRSSHTAKMAVPLLVDAIDGSDYALAAAAVRAAMESPDKEITDALAAELPKTPAERQGLLILALADRGDARALPVVLEGRAEQRWPGSHFGIPGFETNRRRIMRPHTSGRGSRGQ